jgi:hypothetical protein
MQLRRGAFIGTATFMLLLTPPVSAQVTYSHDDGTSEFSVGISLGGDLWWANAFTVQAGGESINTIRIAFYNSSLTGGESFSVHVYDDLDDDGDPATGTLQLVASAAATVIDPTGGTFQDIAIGPVTVAGGFFVAALMTQAASTYPAALDRTASAGQSWVAAGDPSTIDPNDPFASLIVGPGTMDSYGNPGNFLLRAEAGEPPVLTPIPTVGPVGIAVLLALIGLAGATLLRRAM